MSWSSRVLVSVAGLAGLALPAAALAAPLRLPETPYSYTVIDQDLTAAVQEFGSNLNLKVNISPEVRGRVQGRLPELPPRAFLDRLASLYNLEWYYDGQVLHVTSAREVQSRLLVLGPVPFDRLRATLEAFGVTDDRYQVRRAPGADLAIASGPPRFVALVEQTLTGLIEEEQRRPKPAPAAAPPPPGPPPPRPDVVLQVFRGSQAQVIRNGRTESVLTTTTGAPTAPPRESDGEPGRTP